MKKEFIRNILDVEVDGLRQVNHYTIYAMYDLIDDDGFADVHQEIIDEFDYTWEMIQRDGGIGKVTAEIKELYNIEEII